MLIYQNSGYRDFEDKPIPVNSRPGWEFYVSLSKGISLTLLNRKDPLSPRQNTLWVFPQEHPHGWVTDGGAERIVFHFTAVPSELENKLPDRGYYWVPLSKKDIERIRELVGLAAAIMAHPTDLILLQTQAIVSELSLIALRETDQESRVPKTNAQRKTEQALAWYRDHVGNAPGFDEVAAAVHVSPTHLRRLFRQAVGESPHRAFNRIRMKVAEDLLKGTRLTLDEIAGQLGFSSGSALSRAVKAHAGLSPRQIRRGHNPVRRYGQ